MNTLHEEVTIADDSLTIRECSTVDNNILANDILVANDKLRSITTIVEVLRLSTKHGILEHLVALAQASAVQYANVRIDDTVVAYHNVVFDICERINSNVVTNLRLWAYTSLVTNIAHNVIVLLFRTTSKSRV
ncbi:putative uncharacterized protein [Prevotella sp. CAG:1092]|nr:putative uncharacterized protein [Prevotella sp. CAG:1092]